MQKDTQSFPMRVTYWLKVVSLGLLLGLGLQFAQGWTAAPTVSPPDGNVIGPVTLGTKGQWKEGGLAINTGWDTTNDGIIDTWGTNGLLVPHGNVGIGTITPNESKGIGGYLDAADVYIRSVGKWVSEIGGGGGSVEFPTGYYEVYSNANGEDVYGKDLAGGSPSGKDDTCHGDTLNQFSCPPYVNRTCTDYWRGQCTDSIGDRCLGWEYFKRTVTCKAVKVLVKDDPGGTASLNMADYTCTGWGGCTTPTFNVCDKFGKYPEQNPAAFGFSLKTQAKGTAWCGDQWYETSTNFTYGTAKDVHSQLCSGRKAHCVRHIYDGVCGLWAEVYYCGRNTEQNITNTVNFLEVK